MFPFLFIQFVKQVLENCVYYDAFGYLSLLLKYFDKNNICIEYGIDHENVVALLLEKSHLSLKWLKLLIQCYKRCGKSLSKEEYNKAIEICEKTNLDKRYKEMIEKEFRIGNETDKGK